LKDVTAGELWARREALETAGATLLGKMLFAFARIDVNLGLCLVWVDSGTRIESLTRQVSEWSFSRRLECLEAAVNRILPDGHAGRNAYVEWIARAQALRQTRNELVHGRWGVDPAQEKVLNVVGLPTSPDQREIGYTLEDLEAMLREMEDLQTVLVKLRKRWPL
jgi:hypothetical protein